MSRKSRKNGKCQLRQIVREYNSKQFTKKDSHYDEMKRIFNEDKNNQMFNFNK